MMYIPRHMGSLDAFNYGVLDAFCVGAARVRMRCRGSCAALLHPGPFPLSTQ
jgi:hypothetical protein